MSEDPPRRAAARSDRTGSPSSKEGKKASFIVCGIKFTVDSKYKLTRAVGNGAHGVVCAAVNTDNGQRVAIKKITRAFDNINQTKRTLREIRILRQCNHENILRLVDVMRPDSFESFDDVYVVTELMDTDLHQIIRSSQELSDQHVQYFLYQILRGLKFIHSAHVLHRDLKPSNLLLNSDCELKICDYGLARVAVHEENHADFLTEYVATRWYRAPEVMLSWKKYTKAIDVWSVGCIFAELLGRRPLFPGKDYLHQLHLVIDTLGTPSFEDADYIASDKAKAYIRALPHRSKVSFKQLYPKASELALHLLERMLTFSPEKRITVEDALAHPYLQALHDPQDEPVSTSVIDFSFEHAPQTKETYKALLWNEIAHFHPEMEEEKHPVKLLESSHSTPTDSHRQHTSTNTATQREYDDPDSIDFPSIDRATIGAEHKESTRSIDESSTS